MRDRLSGMASPGPADCRAQVVPAVAAYDSGPCPCRVQPHTLQKGRVPGAVETVRQDTIWRNLRTHLGMCGDWRHGVFGRSIVESERNHSCKPWRWDALRTYFQHR